MKKQTATQWMAFVAVLLMTGSWAIAQENEGGQAPINDDWKFGLKVENVLNGHTQATAELTANAPKCPLPGDDWVFAPEFSDESNGDNIDSEKWWDFNPAWRGRKPALFKRDNVVVKDGMLILIGRVAREGEIPEEDVVRGYHDYTKAIVKSKQRVRYGYLEIRAKGMKSSYCNAFWLYDPVDPPAKYRSGEFSEEIDIFEFFGHPKKASSARAYFTTVHRMMTPYVESIAFGGQDKLPNKTKTTYVDFDFWADFHTYALEWNENELIWYLDGKEVFRRTNDVFKRGLHIMLDCEVMLGWDGGLPDVSELPAEFQIDYLRVWQKPE